MTAPVEPLTGSANGRQTATESETTSLLGAEVPVTSESTSYGTSLQENETPPEAVPTDSEDGDTGSTSQENAQGGDEELTTDGEDARDGTIGVLTRRLRCLFSTITWPIVPLGTIVALALLWVLYAASSLDLRRSCSHPLHWYALASLVLVAYIPHHAQVRSHLFQYSRERDGPIRPARVRMYDQFFHTVCLLYVYTGVTLIQTCNDDIIREDDADETLDDKDDKTPAEAPLNTCAATCPNLYQALSVYVATLEMFTFALMLPLLFLPCIYLWFLRRATAEAEAFAQLQDRLQEEEALLSNGGVTANEILDNLENVKLVSRMQPENSEERQIWILSSSGTNASIGRKTDVKECCICMSEFPVQEDEDLESGMAEDGNEDGPTIEEPNPPDPSTNQTQTTERGIVRTQCGHLFHKECLSGWVGGRWQLNPQANNNDSNQERRRRRARQTCCPLCREDLRPTTD